MRYLEEELATPAGLDEYMSDTIDVDFDAIDKFLQRIPAWANLDHSSVQLLLRGTMSICSHLRLAAGYVTAERDSCIPKIGRTRRIDLPLIR